MYAKNGWLTSLLVKMKEGMFSVASAFTSLYCHTGAAIVDFAI